jgi:hypothetical protein
MLNARCDEKLMMNKLVVKHRDQLLSTYLSVWSCVDNACMLRSFLFDLHLLAILFDLIDRGVHACKGARGGKITTTTWYVFSLSPARLRTDTNSIV